MGRLPPPVEPAVNIPTVSPVGLVAFAIVVGGLGVSYLRK
jgi:hypothetical protein